MYSALNEYLHEAKEIEILPAIRLLIAEFIKYLVCRIQYYYPPLLPKAMLVEQTKTGEIDASLWIALEDLHAGWDQSGEVGQEVYGAGIAFGIIPKQYIRVPNEKFLIFIDYPILSSQLQENEATISLGGDEKLNCKVRLIHKDHVKAYRFSITLKQGKNTSTLNAIKNTKEMTVFELQGNQKFKLTWSS